MSDPRVQYRWLDPTTPNAESDWAAVEKVLVARQWMSLNRYTSRILLAEDEDGNLVGFFVFQLIPFAGPLWLHPSERGTETATDMARQMWEFLTSANVRGWIAGGESPHGERLCKMFGMEKIEYPMYIAVGMEPGRKPI